MWPESFRPMFFHERPPSSERYTPSPTETDRWPLFSPVPTHSTLWLVGSMVMQPIEYEPSPSKMGVYVTPLSVVFQSPPEAAAT